MATLVFAFGLQYPMIAQASEAVRFSGASVPPTPFKIKQFKAKGIELKPDPGIPLVGHLSKPDGTGPFAAVVLFHGCFGIRPYQAAWAAKLTEWGYVVFQVDSFGPRNVEETCTNLLDAFFLGIGGNNVLDAYGALSYLRSLPYVDGGRVAMMGWGVNPVLSAVARQGQQRYFDEKFRAAIMLYPACAHLTSGDVYAPVLVLIGEKDDWTLADYCEQMSVAAKDYGVPVDLHVYPGAYHGFDDPNLGEVRYYDEVQNMQKTPARGATLGYNVVAHQDAQEQVRAFLAEHLK